MEPPVAVTVEFSVDGRCVVHGAGAEARSPAGGGFRCPVPYAALAGRPVDLRVVLPENRDRSDSTFPRLDWRREDDRWIGRAQLPSAPAFVRVPGAAVSPGAPEVAFGWNFYGFFVFAAAFILVYFSWARWMDRRDATRTLR